ncbi:MAG TPA: aminotransferase class III-fold pyridoxal phosphate-dependent enzyme [Chthoniobacterales bacterium]
MHPFTSMHYWCAPDHEPLVLVEGHGAVLQDSRGREYIDGNSSIWTNIHGHNHPHMNAAIRRQLERVAHTSFLDFTNPPAIELARSIVKLFPPNTLTRVFYSDDGSTGMEADEVLTGFGRTGRMFACQHENVIPGIMILAKVLTGGYLSLAITLLTEQIFSTFAASSEAERTLYYGHSYTGNALACAAGNASLEIFEKENVLGSARGKDRCPALRDGPTAGAALGRERASVRIDRGSGIESGSRRKTWSSRVPGRAQPRTPNETDPQRDCLDATFLHHALSVAPGRPSHRVRARRGLWRKIKW